MIKKKKVLDIIADSKGIISYKKKIIFGYSLDLIAENKYFFEKKCCIWQRP